MGKCSGIYAFNGPLNSMLSNINKIAAYNIHITLTRLYLKCFSAMLHNNYPGVSTSGTGRLLAVPGKSSRFKVKKLYDRLVEMFTAN